MLYTVITLGALGLSLLFGEVESGSFLGALCFKGAAKFRADTSLSLGNCETPSAATTQPLCLCKEEIVTVHVALEQTQDAE